MSDWIIENNRAFLERGAAPGSPKVPERGTAVVTCMDARLLRLLPDALGISDGDVAMIRNDGGRVTDPEGETMRAVLVAVYELGVRRVVFIAHTDCGAMGITPREMGEGMLGRGIPREELESRRELIARWLVGFESPESCVRSSIDLVRGHPLMPPDVEVDGFVIDVRTGELSPVGAS